MAAGDPDFIYLPSDDDDVNNSFRRLEKKGGEKKWATPHCFQFQVIKTKLKVKADLSVDGFQPTYQKFQQ